MYFPTVHSSPPSFHSDLPPNYPHHPHLNDTSRDAQSSTLPALPILPSISPPITIAEYNPNEKVAHKYAQHLSGALTSFRAELEPSYTLPFYNPSPSDVPGVTPIVTYPPSTALVTGVLVSPHGAGLSSGTLSTFPQQSKGANAQNPARTGYATPDGYRCPMYSCGRLYKHMGHLKRHLRTHTMEKPYLCPKCPKRFSRSDNLNLHLRTHERSGFPSGTAMKNNVPSYTLPFYNPSPSDVPGATPIVTYSPSTAPVRGILLSPHGAGLSSGTLSTFPQQSKDANAQNPARTYMCPLYSCGRLFKRMEQLKRHLRSHPMQKPYSCPKCPERFSRSDSLNQHLRTHEISGFPSGTAMKNNVGAGGMDGGGMVIDIGAVVPGGRPAHKGSFESELAHRRRDESAPVPRERPYPYPRLGIRGVQRSWRAPPSQYSSMAENFGLGSPEARERAGLGAATFVHRQAHEELILPSQQQSNDLNAQNMQEVTTGGFKVDAELPSVFLPTSGRASFIGEPPTTPHLSDSVTISEAATAENIWRLLVMILSNKLAYKTLLRLKDEKAQIMLEILQKALDSKDIPVKLGHAARHAMVRLCTASSIYPRCLALQDLHYEATPVASGAFGDIWKGNHGNHPVRLKVARVCQGSDVEHLFKTYMREAIVWSHFSHPNLLPFYGIYRVDDRLGRICLVSPWMQNGNVNEYLKAYPEAPRLPLVRDIVEGLRHLHKQNVVHGDLKGANILISRAGSACLADFGLSSIIDSEILRWTSLKSMTRIGGTVRWQAPEVMDGSGNDFRPTFSADVYSVASVMYEVFTDQLPFYEIRNDVIVMIRVIQGLRLAKPPLDQAPELSNEIWEVMESCWSSNPIKRPSINRVAKRLSRGRPTETTISRINMQEIQRKRDVGEDMPTPSSFRAAMRGQTTNFSKAEIDTLEEFARDSSQPTFSHGKYIKPTATSRVRPGGLLSPPPSQEMTSLDLSTSLDLFAPPSIGATDLYFQGFDTASDALGSSFMSTGMNGRVDSLSETISDMFIPPLSGDELIMEDMQVPSSGSFHWQSNSGYVWFPQSQQNMSTLFEIGDRSQGTR